MSRQLVTIRTIDEINPIKDRDLIVEATVDGWHAIVKKGEFAPGDQCVFFEVDSMLPINDPRFAFLADRGVKDRPDGSLAHRLKTMRMAGVISQGLVLPVTEFTRQELMMSPEMLQEQLGVTLYEPPASRWSLPGTRPTNYGPFPHHLVMKTDSERVQNLKKHWDTIAHEYVWVGTEKIDGTSMTVARGRDDELIIASRNWQQDPDVDTVYRRAVEKFDLDLLKPVAVIQGEIFGPGVQGNSLDMSELEFRVFYYVEDRHVVPRNEWPDLARRFAVPMIPFLLGDTVAEAVAQVDGLMSMINPSRMAEGIVWHEMTAQPVRELEYRSTFKAVSNAYLLKNDG